MLVEKSIDSGPCDNFNDYFTFISREKQNQNNNVSLKLPAVKAEFTRRLVFFSHATLYGKLSRSVWQKKCGQLNPRKFLKTHFENTGLWSGI